MIPRARFYPPIFIANIVHTARTNDPTHPIFAPIFFYDFYYPQTYLFFRQRPGSLTRKNNISVGGCRARAYSAYTRSSLLGQPDLFSLVPRARTCSFSFRRTKTRLENMISEGRRYILLRLLLSFYRSARAEVIRRARIKDYFHRAILRARARARNKLHVRLTAPGPLS